MPTRDDAFRLSDEALERLKPEGAAPATDEAEAETPEKPETPAKPDEKPAPAPAPAEPEPDEDEGDDEDDAAEGDAAPDAEALEKIAAEVEALLKEEAP